MEKDTLTTILDEERSILDRLATERSRSEERLAQLRLKTDEEFSGEKERLEASMRQALDIAGDEAENRAAGLVTEATLLAERLHRLDDSILQQITLRHLKAILPRG